MSCVIIIGGGYSVTEGLQKGLWNKIEKFTTISLNSVYKMMPYLPTIQLWVDKDFFMHDIDELQQLAMKGVHLVAKEHFKLKPFAMHIELIGSSRVKENYYGKDSLKKNTIYYGAMGLSGAFALGYCIAKGYETIYLLGYDFGNKGLNNHKTHWYQDSVLTKNIYSTGAGRPEVYRDRVHQERTNKFIEDFKVYTQEDTKIFNVSIESNIPYFPKLTYDEFFERLKDEKPKTN